MIYEYFCEKCDVVMEHEKGMNDPDPEACPLCGVKNKKGKEKVFYRKFSCNFAMPGSTVMSLAEQNSKKMGRQQIKDIYEKKKETRHRVLKKQAESVGAKLVEDKGNGLLGET